MIIYAHWLLSPMSQKLNEDLIITKSEDLYLCTNIITEEDIGDRSYHGPVHFAKTRTVN